MIEALSMIRTAGRHSPCIIRPEVTYVAKGLAGTGLTGPRSFCALPHIPHYANILVKQARMDLGSAHVVHVALLLLMTLLYWLTLMKTGALIVRGPLALPRLGEH